MNKWKVKTTLAFDNELLDILEYIQNELEMPETALKQFLRIEEVVLGLELMPERNPLYKGAFWKGRNLRKAIVDNYVVFYEVKEEKQEVFVLHVFYGGRNIDELL